MEMRDTKRKPVIGGKLVWNDILRIPDSATSQELTFQTTEGDISAHYYPVLPGEQKLLGGIVLTESSVDGDLCGKWQNLGVACLRLHLRSARQPEQSVLETLLGVEFLVREGIQRVVLVGGREVLAAGSNSDAVKAIAAFAVLEPTEHLAPRPVIFIRTNKPELEALVEWVPRQLTSEIATEPEAVKNHKNL